MDLSPEAQAALDALPIKRRVFVIALSGEQAGNATAAARKAGYAKPEVEGCRLMRDGRVRLALSLVQRVPLVEPTAIVAQAIANADEALAFWSAVMRGEMKETKVDADGFAVEQPVAMRDRLKASELLGKAKGLFAADQSPQVQVGVQLVVTRETAIQVIEATREGEGR